MSVTPIADEPQSIRFSQPAGSPIVRCITLRHEYSTRTAPSQILVALDALES